VSEYEYFPVNGYRFVAPDIDFAPDVIVFRSGDYAVAKDKNGDIIAISKDHASVIQAAINHVAEQGGGKIYIAPEDYVISKRIYVKYDNITIFGAGTSTKLVMKDNTPEEEYRMFEIKKSDVEGVKNFIMAFMYLDGNRENQLSYTTTPALVSSSGENLWFIGLTIRGSMGDGIEAAGKRMYFIGNRITSCVEHEIHLNDVEDAVIVGNHIHDCGKECIALWHSAAERVVIANNVLGPAGLLTTDDGVDVISLSKDATRNRDIVITGNIINISNSNHGVRIGGWKRVSVINNIIIGITGRGYVGIRVEASETTNAEDIIIRENIIYNVKHSGIRVDYGTRIAIKGNKLLDVGQYNEPALWLINTVKSKILDNDIISTVTDKPNYCILEDTGCDYNEIWRNLLEGYTTAALSKTGANTIVRRNIGYVTENSGVATLSGDGSTTDFLIGSHGLSPSIDDPSKVVVKCTPASPDAIAASPLTCYLSDEEPDGVYESIRVKFSSAPASGTDNVKVVWEVEYIG